MKNLVLLFMLLSVAVSGVQLNKDQITNYLTNSITNTNASRIWIFGSYKTSLGDGCDGDGQSWEFFKKDKLVVIRWCIDGKKIIQKANYTIDEIPNKPGEYSINLSTPVEIKNGIKIRSMRINLILPEIKKRNKIMKWDDLPSCKTCIHEIVEFKSRN